MNISNCNVLQVNKDVKNVCAFYWPMEGLYSTSVRFEKNLKQLYRKCMSFFTSDTKFV